MGGAAWRAQLRMYHDAEHRPGPRRTSSCPTRAPLSRIRPLLPVASVGAFCPDRVLHGPCQLANTARHEAEGRTELSPACRGHSPLWWWPHFAISDRTCVCSHLTWFEMTSSPPQL